MATSESTAQSRQRRGRQHLDDGTVRVWSEVGLTLPVGDTTAHIRFLFGHERIAKNSTEAEISRTEKLIDAFNEEVVERKVRKYTRLIGAWQGSEEEEGKEDTRSRARRRAKEKLEGRS